MIASDLLRGSVDTIILAQLAKHDSYGYEINKEILRKTNGRYELKEATLYSAFKRLTDNGCITSYWGDGNQGARRRYYSITPTGLQTLDRLQKDWNDAKTLIDSLVCKD